MPNKPHPETHLPKYSLFYDFHTSPDYPGVGKCFDADAFTDRLRKCGVDFLTFHARCNMGMAYYDTALGIRHPSLTYDLFGKLAEACARKKIALSAYFNGGISQAECVAHPDWCVVPFDDGKATDSRDSALSRLACCNSPYHEHLLGMVREVAEKYPVAGFFLDCMQTSACLCRYCIGKMNKQGIDWHDREQVLAFNRRSWIKFAEDVSQTAKAVNPGFLIYFNCLDYEDQTDAGTYLECECIPSRSDWGYEYLPVLSRYMRTLGNKPLLNMTGRFFSWGDFGGLRSQKAIRYELLYGLANGMRPNIGDHFLPHGDLCSPVLDMVEEIYREFQQLEPWFSKAGPVTEVAVVYPKNISNIRNDLELRGVVRMLGELKQQFDIVTKVADWSKYKLLIFPDSVTFDTEIAERVRLHLASGGKIIASGWSGLNPEKDKIVFPEAWGVEYHGDCKFRPVYFQAQTQHQGDLPDMPISIYAGGIQMRPSANTQVAAWLVKPEFNQGWDGIYPNYYCPPETITEWPFITLTKQVAHFSHALFTGYKQKAPSQLRSIFARIMHEIWPRPLLRIPESPSFLRAFVTRQPGRDMIHLFAYQAEQRGVESEIVEDELIVQNLTVMLRADGRIPSAVYTAPERTALEFAADDYIRIKLPQVQGYTMIAVEFSGEK